MACFKFELNNSIKTMSKVKNENYFNYGYLIMLVIHGFYVITYIHVHKQIPYIDMEFC